MCSSLSLHINYVHITLYPWLHGLPTRVVWWWCWWDCFELRRWSALCDCCWAVISLSVCMLYPFACLCFVSNSTVACIPPAHSSVRQSVSPSVCLVAASECIRFVLFVTQQWSRQHECYCNMNRMCPLNDPMFVLCRLTMAPWWSRWCYLQLRIMQTSRWGRARACWCLLSVVL